MDDSSHGSVGEMGPSSSGCALVEESSQPAKDNTVLSPDSYGGSVGGYSIGVSPQGLNVGSRDPQPALFDEMWRNRVLAQKAQALGLLSRDWARTTHVRRTAGGYDSKVTSRPPTREANFSRPPTRAHPHRPREPHPSTKDTRPPTRNTRPPTRGSRPPTRDTHLPSPSTGETTIPLPSTRQATTSCPPTREATSYRHSLSKQPANPHSDKKDDDKLEQLRSIYKPPSSSQTDKQSRRSPSKLRCESRSTSRQTVEGSTQNQRRKKSHLSRPATRTGRKLEPSLSLRSEAEESQYWNEVAQGGQEQPQFQVRNGMQLRVESQPLTRRSQTPVHVPLHTDQQFKYLRTHSHLPQPPLLLTGRRRSREGSLKPGPITGQISTYPHNQQTQQKMDSSLGIRVTSNT